MGSESIPKRTAGNRDDADWFNLWRRTLAEDIVPRNFLAEAEDQVGSLGTSTYRFLYAYLMELKLSHEESSNFISLLTPSGMSSDWDLTLPPALPPNTGSAKGLLYVNSSGESVIVAPDDSTLEATSSSFRIKDQGITFTQLGDDPNVTSSSGSGSFSTTSTTYVDVTNLSISFTSFGHPVFLSVMPDGAANNALYSGNAAIRFLRDASEISTQRVSSSPRMTAASIRHKDIITAGTYTYKVQIKSLDGGSVSAAGMILRVWEPI